MGANHLDGTDESVSYTGFLDGPDQRNGFERFPKPCVACSIHAGGAQLDRSRSGFSQVSDLVAVDRR